MSSFCPMNRGSPGITGQNSGRATKRGVSVPVMIGGQQNVSGSPAAGRLVGSSFFVGGPSSSMGTVLLVGRLKRTVWAVDARVINWPVSVSLCKDNGEIVSKLSPS